MATNSVPPVDQTNPQRPALWKQAVVVSQIGSWTLGSRAWVVGIRVGPMSGTTLLLPQWVPIPGRITELTEDTATIRTSNGDWVKPITEIYQCREQAEQAAITKCQAILQSFAAAFKA